MSQLIYLAGPISGLTYKESAHGWRQKFQREVDGRAWDDIDCVSPMRGKGFLDGEGPLKGDNNHPHPLASHPGILTRDAWDVRRCDLMVACFLECGGRISIGTCCEFGLAHAFDKPIITIMEPGNVHEHVFIRQMSGYIVPTIEEAAELAVILLTPGL